MIRVPGFVTHVIETMRSFGPVVAKPMFGGWGLYRDGAFFALIFEDALYFKVDQGNRADFAARGLAPFVYSAKGGESIELHYHAAPEEALESPEEMAKWARGAYAAALRKRAAGLPASKGRRSARPPRKRPLRA